MSKTRASFKIFQDCIQYISLPYWKTMFLSFSKGKFPVGVKVMNGHIICKRRRFSHQEEIPTDPKKASEMLLDFFTNTLKMKSPEKIINQNNKIKNEISNSENIYWSSIKGITTKRFLLERYASDLRDIYNFTKKEYSDFLNSLIIALHMNLIKDVDLMGTKILHIEGVEFDPESKKLFLKFTKSQPDKLKAIPLFSSSKL